MKHMNLSWLGMAMLGLILSNPSGPVQGQGGDPGALLQFDSVVVTPFGSISVPSSSYDTTGAIVADLDLDGDQDIAMLSPFNNTLLVFLNQDGSGESWDPLDHVLMPVNPIQQGAASALTTTDFNNDQIPDVAVARYNQGIVQILLGTGLGGFQNAGSVAIGAPARLGAADFNEDGLVDLAVVDQIESTVTLLVGDGLGGFTLQLDSFVEVNDTLESVSIDDANQDGHLDLIVPCPLQAVVAVVHGDGAGNFALSSTYPVGLLPLAALTGDFDEDGFLDIVVSNRDSNSVSLLEGQSSGGFVPMLAAPTGPMPWGVGTADFDGDGLLDVATTNAMGGSISILRNDGAGGFDTTSSILVNPNPRALAIGDFDGDARWDLVTVCHGSTPLDGAVMVLLNRTPLPPFLRGDANRDSAVDIGDAVTVLQLLFSNGTSTCPDAADFNDSGDLDIADAIGLFLHLLADGPAPTLPGPNDCGVDPTPDLLDGCLSAGC